MCSGHRKSMLPRKGLKVYDQDRDSEHPQAKRVSVFSGKYMRICCGQGISVFRREKCVEGSGYGRV